MPVVVALHVYQHCEVDCDDGLEVTALKVDGGVIHDDQEDGGQEHCQDDIFQSLHLHRACPLFEHSAFFHFKMR